jgi:hypothetical protein
MAEKEEAAAAEEQVQAERSEANRKPARPYIAAAIVIVIAGVTGLSIGKAAKSDDLDPASARQQAMATARKATTPEARSISAQAGYREGRAVGTRRGRKSGKATGQADGQIQSQVKAVIQAQQATSAAQSALAEISEPPPAPSP